MKPKWPTLQGRLKHPLTDELTALQQLKNSGVALSEYAEKKLAKLLKKKRIFSSNRVWYRPNST